MHGVVWLTNARRIVFGVLAVVCVAGLSGCAIDRFPEKEQRLRVTVTEKATGRPVVNAVVCWQFPADGFDPEALLKYKREQNHDCRPTDFQGNANLPVMVPLDAPEPDRFLGRAIAFRVDSEDRADFMFGQNLRSGDVLPGRNFLLKIVDNPAPDITKQ